MTQNPWPALPWSAWRDTAATLHLWLQIAGKIRMTLTPLINHWNTHAKHTLGFPSSWSLPG